MSRQADQLHALSPTVCACGSGGECGLGCPASFGCSSHRCLPATSLYSCQQPAPLVSLNASAGLLGRHTLFLNLSALSLLDEVRPACSATGYQPDAIFSFTVDERYGEHGVGVDAWLRGAINAEVDTLLEIRKGRCSDLPRNASNADAVAADAALPEQGQLSRRTDHSLRVIPPHTSMSRLALNTLLKPPLTSRLL